LAAVLSAACGSATAPPQADTAASARPEVIQLSAVAIANAGIVVEPVQTVTRAVTIVAPGLLALDEMRTARIGALQEGLVMDTSAQVGDRVRARQVLARLHSHDVHDGWAGYRKALAERRRAENQRAFAIEAHERAKRLYADKAVSLQEVQRADVDRVAAVQGVDVAQAEVLRAVEELEHLGIEVSPDATTTDETLRVRGNSNEQIPIRSPIGGVVLERLVTPGTTVTPGTPLFVVSDLSTLWAVAEIDEALLPRVKAGRRVDVSVAAYPGEAFPGTITFVADLVNPKTRRITVRCTVPNSDGRLKPEMFATVALGEGDPKPVLVVPAAAIQSIDGQPVVFVERENGQFVPRRITAGASARGQVEVTMGLSAGERVAVAGSFALKSELLKTGGD
jgi:cobalt-zinc-cadmium efflux system membrane fusion protein